MNSKIKFVNSKLKASFKKLQDSTSEDYRLGLWLNSAMDSLEDNAFCGMQIRKRLIPKDYLCKYDVNNLWKYNLPNGWRLIYSIVNHGEVVFSVLIDWMNHKDYEKKFKYNKK